MAIDLNSIKRGVTLAPPRMVVYGPHGVGKTTFAAKAPGAIVLPLEDGIGKIDVPHFPLLKSWQDVYDAVSALFGAHEYKTAVVDTIDWLEPLIWAETCRRNKWTDIEVPGFGKGYQAADDVWREFFEWMVQLRDRKGMQVILLAHTEVKQFNDPMADPYDRYRIKLQKRASDLVQEWADAVLFANFKVYTTKVDAGFKKTITKGTGGGERFLATEERPGYYAKNRYGLPPELPFEYADLSAAIFQPTA